MTIASWRLPLRFDPERLLADLARIEDAEWEAHFNTGTYDGDWSGVALRAPRGSSTPLYPDPLAAGFEPTSLLDRCPYFAEVLASFACELESVRLLRLRAGSVIREHRDYKLGLEDGVLRLHIPIITNPGVRFYLQGRPVPMAVGEAWYLNVNLPHRVENTGATDRVHLVIDGVVNDWVRGLISPSDADEEISLPTPEPDLVPPALPARNLAPVSDANTALIIAFLREIGLVVHEQALAGPTFLPGIALVDGALVVDPAQLRYPGDLLHEAGHLAVAEPARRPQISGSAGDDPAEEMMAIAWSYAAGVQLQLDPSVVFHDDGYKGGAANMREAFTSGGYIGLPMLQWVGMALDARQAEAQGLPAYPAMLRWLRPER
jgi:hypothetical protein